MNFAIQTSTILEAIGVGGFLLYVLNYGMLTLRYINGHSITYFALNLLAASAVLIGLTVSFNLASAMIQVFWVIMSTIGMALHMRRTGPDENGSLF